MGATVGAEVTIRVVGIGASISRLAGNKMDFPNNAPAVIIGTANAIVIIINLLLFAGSSSSFCVGSSVIKDNGDTGGSEFMDIEKLYYCQSNFAISYVDLINTRSFMQIVFIHPLDASSTDDPSLPHLLYVSLLSAEFSV